MPRAFVVLSSAALFAAGCMAAERDPVGNLGTGGDAASSAPSSTSSSTTGSGGVGVGVGGASMQCDADLLTDTMNCGTCGHDCLGGACQDGICQPVVVYTGFIGFDSPDASTFAIDGQSIYFTHQVFDDANLANTISYLHEIPIGGGMPTVLANAPYGNQSWIFGLSISGADPDNVYFSYFGDTADQNLVAKVPKGGGPVVPLIAPAARPSSVVFAGGKVYYAAGDFNGSCLYTIEAGAAVPIANGPCFDASLLVNDDHYLYATSTTLDPDQGATVEIWRIPLDGSPASKLASQTDPFPAGTSNSANTAGGIALNSTDVFWSRRGDWGTFNATKKDNGSVWKVSKNGGAPKKLAEGFTVTGGVAADDANVYVLTHISFVRIPVEGGGPTTLRGHPVLISPGRQLALTNGAVYWVERAETGVNSYTGTILKLAK